MLIANNITMQFGAKPLFENVSVKFGDGNRYGLIGANGAGKSTFMKILAGVLGCRFASLEGDGAMRLHDWLTIHVISTATVRISESEAAAIVSGPSLI